MTEVTKAFDGMKVFFDVNRNDIGFEIEFEEVLRKFLFYPNEQSLNCQLSLEVKRTRPKYSFGP